MFEEQKDWIRLVSVNINDAPGFNPKKLQHINCPNIQLLSYCGAERCP
jgi:hypothetical protein